jgi:hypothetical protein
MHVNGYAAKETKAAIERARSLIEQGEAVGERLEDPLLLFSVLLGVWVANFVAFNGYMVRQLAEQYLELAYQQPTIAPRLVAHRLMGSSRLMTGEIKEAIEHYSQVIASSPDFSGVGSVVAWVSRRGTHRCGACAEGCARNQTRSLLDAYFREHMSNSHPLRLLRTRE